MQFFDELNREVSVPNEPQRIISLVPSLTELLHEMGLEKQLVGITKYCVHPIHYQSTKTKVGGTKKVKFDAIKELKPDFILCSKEENTEEMVQELEKMATVYVSDVNTFEESLLLIRKLGIILHRRMQADRIVQKIKDRQQEFQSFLQGRKKYAVVYFIWAEPWMVAGGKTFINNMIKVAGFTNAYEHLERYPEVKINRIRFSAHNPEVLMFSSEPYDFSDEEVYEVVRKNKNLLTIYVDGQYFSWYGSRLSKAFDHFKEIHKKLAEY